jgi:hypothetical protein
MGWKCFRCAQIVFSIVAQGCDPRLARLAAKRASPERDCKPKLYLEFLIALEWLAMAHICHECYKAMFTG